MVFCEIILSRVKHKEISKSVVFVGHGRKSFVYYVVNNFKIKIKFSLLFLKKLDRFLLQVRLVSEVGFLFWIVGDNYCSCGCLLDNLAQGWIYFSRDGFLNFREVYLSKFGMKLVPLLTSSVRSDGKLIMVKLWTFLVVESFSLSCMNRYCRERRFSCSKIRALFSSHCLIHNCWCVRKLFRLIVKSVIRFLRL